MATVELILFFAHLYSMPLLLPGQVLMEGGLVVTRQRKKLRRRKGKSHLRKE